MTIISADATIHFFFTYARQTGRPDAEKNASWQPLDAKTCNVPDDDITIAGDLNGHVGEKPVDMGKKDFDHVMSVASI